LKRSLVLAAFVFLMLGLGFGGVFFPQTVTKTSTQTSTQTTTEVTTLTITTNSTISIVTATVVGIEVYPVLATCTSVNGVRSVTFVTQGIGGTTTQTTIFPPNLPKEYSVTFVTASLGSASFQTYTNSPDICP
jgi:hypothetical protein